MNFSWLVSSSISLLIIAYGLEPTVVARSNSVLSKCAELGCLHSIGIPTPTCSIGIVTFSQSLAINDGACGCPEHVCSVINNGCNISGTYTVSIVDAQKPTHDLFVGGINFGDSYTWSPPAISGCGNSNFEVIFLDGTCQLVISLECVACNLSCQ